VNDFVNGEVFWAEENEGAYLNSHAVLLTSAVTSIRDAVVSTQLTNTLDISYIKRFSTLGS